MLMFIFGFVVGGFIGTVMMACFKMAGQDDGQGHAPPGGPVA